MCMIWTQKQWRKAISEPNSVYSLVGEFQGLNGKTVLQVKEQYPSQDTYYWNVYDTKGKSTAFFYSLEEANQQMTARGFVPVDTPEVTPMDDVTTVPVQEENVATEPDDGVYRYQGKTLEEWEHEGELNESRPQTDHVHPTPPEGRAPTKQETEAYVNSLTTTEAVIATFMLSTSEDSTTEDALASA